MNDFSYFFRDNSGLSFFSGEPLSALGFSSLLCGVPELRFLGGILLSADATGRCINSTQNFVFEGDKFG